MTSAEHNQQQISDSEFQRLAQFLEEIGPPAMNMEELDGYFSALICGPGLVPMSRCLPNVWGEDFAFSGEKQASEILAIILHHWNCIAGTLQSTLETPNVYLPVLLLNEEGVSHGNDWARGFMRGVELHPAGWQELFDSEEEGAAVVPMMILAHENDPDPELRSPAIRAQSREDLLNDMIAGLTRIYRHFEPQRRPVDNAGTAPATAPMRRAEPKIGRNEICPCGSGRKCKHCCGATPNSVH
jgi:uncharacterized protein